METNTKTLCGMLLVWIAMASGAYAQIPNPMASGMWDNLKEVPDWQKVLVKLHDGKTRKGRLTSVSDTGLQLSREFKTMEVNRGNVRKVFRLDRGISSTGWMVGMGVGPAALLVAKASQSPENRDLGPRNIPGFLFAIAAGAFIGDKIRNPTRKVLIYDSRLLKSLSIKMIQRIQRNRQSTGLRPHQNRLQYPHSPSPSLHSPVGCNINANH